MAPAGVVYAEGMALQPFQATVAALLPAVFLLAMPTPAAAGDVPPDPCKEVRASGTDHAVTDSTPALRARCYAAGGTWESALRALADVPRLSAEEVGLVRKIIREAPLEQFQVLLEAQRLIRQAAPGRLTEATRALRQRATEPVTLSFDGEDLSRLAPRWWRHFMGPEASLLEAERERLVSFLEERVERDCRVIGFIAHYERMCSVRATVTFAELAEVIGRPPLRPDGR